MKFNANLTQSQNNKGDLGAGADNITSVAGKPNWVDTSGRSDQSVSNRDYLNFNGDQVPEFSTNVTFKYGFVQKIFSVKKTTISAQTRYLYSTFYDPSNFSPMVEMHEIPTMGQVTDYLLKPTSDTLGKPSFFAGGVVTKYVGDHFDSTDDLDMYNLWDDYSGTAKPVGAATWLQSSLARKLKFFLDEIISSSGSTDGLPIHASTFYGGSQVILSGTSVNQVIDDLFAGSHDQTAGTSIFEVHGSASGSGVGAWKYIRLNHQNNQGTPTTKPTGIVGHFGGSEAINDFDLGSYFTFSDLSRYYLRTSSNLHTVGSGKVYLGMSSGGQPTFTSTTTGSAISTHLPNQSATGYVLVQNPLANQNANLYNATTPTNYNFFFNMRAANHGVIFQRTDGAQRYYRATVTNNEEFGLEYYDGSTLYSKVLLKGKVTATSPSDYHFLLSEAEETVYGSVANGATEYFLKLLNSTGTTHAVRLGLIQVGAPTSAASKTLFAVAQHNGGGSYIKCYLPPISNENQFVTTLPDATQEIYNGIVFRSGAKKIWVDAVASSIYQEDVSTDLSIEGVNFRAGVIKSPTIDTPTINTPTITGGTLTDSSLDSPTIARDATTGISTKIKYEKFRSGVGSTGWDSFTQPDKYVISFEKATMAENDLFIIAYSADIDNQVKHGVRDNDYIGVNIKAYFTWDGDEYMDSFDGMIPLSNSGTRTNLAPFTYDLTNSTYKYPDMLLVRNSFTGGGNYSHFWYKFEGTSGDVTVMNRMFSNGGLHPVTDYYGIVELTTIKN